VRFGIHNSSWLDSPDPAEAFEAVKAKAQWAEDHGFVWFSVLDHLISRGRLTLGIGASFFEDEYKQYGWEFAPRPATRIRQVEEAVALILRTWTEPRTTFHGRYFHVEDAILEPKPVQKPRPPRAAANR
jgi:alkanesulfonate monooxygenase SsuD/methylene tetrahydromethanopterin reductase-like flavin-dependent oxidoreductase (luciferase family)